jgi:hypothetical protein
MTETEIKQAVIRVLGKIAPKTDVGKFHPVINCARRWTSILSIS